MEIISRHLVRGVRSGFVGDNLFLLNIKKVGALFFCFYLFISMNSPVLRLLAIPIAGYYISIILIGLLSLILYLNKKFVFTRQRYFLFFSLLFLVFHFSFPTWSGYWMVKTLLAFVPLFFVIFWDNKIYYLTFGYFRKMMIFFAVCSIVVTGLLLFLPYNALPYIELEPLSAVHQNANMIYRIYGIVVSYDMIVFNIGSLSFLRTAGPLSEPGHLGVFLGLTLCIEMLLYKKRTPILIICGCMTFSTAFYVILVIQELYNIFVNRKFDWKVYLFLISGLILLFILIDNSIITSVWDYAIGRNLNEENILDNRTNSTALFLWNKFLHSSSFLRLFVGHGTFFLETTKDLVLADYREFLYDSGLYGFLLLVIVFLGIFIKVKMRYVFLFGSVIVLIFLHRSWMFWYPYVYVLPLIAFGAYTYKSNLESFHKDMISRDSLER